MHVSVTPLTLATRPHCVCRLVANGFKPHDVVLAYKEFDTNLDGLIAFDEFVNFCRDRLELKLAKPEIYEIWRKLDLNGSGVINFSEFTAMLFPDLDMEAIMDSGHATASFKVLMNAKDGLGHEGEGCNSSGGRKDASGNDASSINAKFAEQALKPAASSFKQGGKNRGANLQTMEEGLGALVSSVQAMQAVLGTIDLRLAAIETAQTTLAARCDSIEAAQGLMVAKSDSVETALRVLVDRPRHKSRRQLDGVGELSKDSPPLRQRSSHGRRADMAAAANAMGMEA